jgi:hypothetical protein
MIRLVLGFLLIFVVAGINDSTPLWIEVVLGLIAFGLVYLGLESVSVKKIIYENEK